MPQQVEVWIHKQVPCQIKRPLFCNRSILVNGSEPFVFFDQLWIGYSRMVDVVNQSREYTGKMGQRITCDSVGMIVHGSMGTGSKSIRIKTHVKLFRCIDSVQIFGDSHDDIGSMAKVVEMLHNKKGVREHAMRTFVPRVNNSLLTFLRYIPATWATKSCSWRHILCLNIEILLHKHRVSKSRSPCATSSSNHLLQLTPKCICVPFNPSTFTILVNIVEGILIIRTVA
eukprot:Nitzschia sp. Nitz4//scaffold381_size12975//619//1412//NITZ4_008987-RA/size12975-exonerate_est2genome-gene-0.0-mRNA-1//1//CDS//3329549895//5214//frame0